MSTHILRATHTNDRARKYFCVRGPRELVSAYSVAEVMTCCFSDLQLRSNKKLVYLTEWEGTLPLRRRKSFRAEFLQLCFHYPYNCAKPKCRNEELGMETPQLRKMPVFYCISLLQFSECAEKVHFFSILWFISCTYTDLISRYTKMKAVNIVLNVFGGGLYILFFQLIVGPWKKEKRANVMEIFHFPFICGRNDTLTNALLSLPLSTVDSCFTLLPSNGYKCFLFICGHIGLTVDWKYATGERTSSEKKKNKNKTHKFAG